MSEYVFPCKSNGQCRQLMFNEHGWEWSEGYPKNGVVQVTTVGKFDIPQWRGKYKCCTQCHLPLNQAEAARANKLLGNKLEDVKIDDDFMELLNGF